jgi:sugar phosphate isomerase/epimerase
MRLSIAIADANALLSAFVVYRGFETSIPRAAKLGFEGVELALKRADEINPSSLKRLLENNNLEISCISTGQVYADGGLMLTHESRSEREQAMGIFKELIDVGSEFGQMVNIGRVRGMIGNRGKGEVENLFIEVGRELCDYALQKNVALVLEPINRYETDFVNNISEGVRLLKKIDRPNIGLMPDLFHMNIEERNIYESITENMEFVKYIHVADSNRLAPGNGHINFETVFMHLQLSHYNGWICAEILPTPTPDIAARQAADFLLPLIENYNREHVLKKKMPTNGYTQSIPFSK